MRKFVEPDVADNPLYHDTWKLLKKYRDVVWSLELSVQHVRTKFEIEYGTSIEDFLDSVYLAGADLAGSDIEHHAKCIERSHKMLKLLDSAVELLRTKHKNGEAYYWLLYYSFLSPQQLKNVEEIIETLRPHIRDISFRTYYRKRREAIEALSSVLWGYAEENRNIGEVYRLLTLNGESQLDTLFEALPSTHPAKAPYSLFKQASDTVRSGVIIGLGSRLQVFQSELIKKITAKNEIDLELPGQQPCAYFLVTSDQDSTFDFLASLFLSFCFIKLVRYADHNCEGGKLPVPVHILGEELTACGTIPDLSRRLSVIRSRNISMSCVFQNLAGLQNRYPQNLWQEIIGNCDAQLFLGCTDQLTAEFISARTGLASVAVSSKSKQLGTWRISNYTPEFRETSGVGKRPVLTPDEVLRLPLDQALIIIRGKKVLQVDKMDYSKHPEAKYLRSCKASAHVPEWRRLEEEAAKTPQPTPKPAPAAKKPAKRKATKPASPTDKSPKEAPAPKSAGTPEGIITTDKDSILS